MPELPEVEHVRRHLATWLGGATIVDAKASDPRIADGRSFCARLAGRRVASVERRGKWLRVVLDDGAKLFAHLGMTGDFTRAEETRFERARIEVERRGKRSVIRYTDPRRWGRLVVSKEDIPAWTALGPDPLHDGIDVDRLAQVFARRSRSVKEVIMDQSVLAGVGNIHAIEALWRARVHPRTLARTLDRRAIGAIVRGLHWTIARALADLAKEDQGEDNPFSIYGRRGEPCPRCRTALQRFELGGRTTTACPTCQQQAPHSPRTRARRTVITRPTRAAVGPKA